MTKSDLQDILLVFVYTNLPALMNPESTVTVTDNPAAALVSSPDTIVVSPAIVAALRPYVLNNFTDLNLPSDLGDIVRQFFATTIDVS